MSTVREFIITGVNLNSIVNLVKYFISVPGNIKRTASVVRDFISMKEK